MKPTEFVPNMGFTPFTFTELDGLTTFGRKPQKPNPYEIEVQRIVDAIKNEGINPQYHRRVMRRHRRQWGVLWSALDALVRKYEEENGDKE